MQLSMLNFENVKKILKLQAQMIFSLQGLKYCILTKIGAVKLDLLERMCWKVAAEQTLSCNWVNTSLKSSKRMSGMPQWIPRVRTESCAVGFG